jgi:hypothetical protein
MAKRPRLRVDVDIPTEKGLAMLRAAIAVAGQRHKSWVFPDGLKERHEFVIGIAPGETESELIAALRSLFNFPGIRITPPWPVTHPPLDDKH